MSVFPPQAHFHLMAKPSSFHCNIQCEYCFYLEKSEQFGQHAPFMSKDTLKHYVKNYIQSHASNVVEFAWQGGEPTLLGLDFYKQAVEYQQEFAQGKQITNAFQTNGIAFNQQWAAFFKQHHFLIGLSIDGLSAVHNRYRISGNGNPTFEKVVKALNLLQEYGVEFNTLTVINDQNWQKGKETYLALKQLGSTYMQFIPIVERHAQTQSVTDFSVPSEGYGQFLVDVFHEWYAHDVDVAGLATEQKNIPTNGKATYIGRGFFNGATATFIYNVNFNIKKGQGRLTEMGGSGKLTLQEADIKRINLKGNNIIGVEGKAESSYNHLVDGHYQLGFFGPNAEEVSGLATFSMEEKRKTAGTTKNDHNKFEFGLGGTRGEIQK